MIIHAGNPSLMWGTFSLLNIFARGFVMEEFENIVHVANYSPFIKKMLIALPIFYETRDIFLTLLLTLSFLIINEITKDKLAPLKQKNEIKEL
jgi:hypothetical protein